MIEVSRQKAVGRRQHAPAFCLLLSAFCLLVDGCGYTTRPGLASYLKTVYVKPLTNKIDLTQLTNDYQHFPVYRHGLESDVTTAIINRFQFTGLLRPASPANADSRLEGELVDFRRDALRYNASHMGLDPATWVIVMPWAMFYELTEVWPCAYVSYRCTVDGDNNRGVIDLMVYYSPLIFE